MRGRTRPLDRFGAAATLSICVVWGFNQVVVKAALAEIGPIAQSGVRSAIGCVCVIVYAALTRRRIFRIDGTEAAGALAGILFTLEFTILFESLRWTTAARSVVFLYAAPFFVALSAAVVWQGAGVVGATYLVWFWLLGRYSAAQLSAFTFVTPLIGVRAGSPSATR